MRTNIAINQVGTPVESQESAPVIRLTKAVNRGLKDELSADLTDLAALVANATEAYSAVIFMADASSSELQVAAHHTLSRDFIADASIPFGSGLVGWAAENKNKVCVCPFDNDSSTLLYYSADQLLKSFIALPILDKSGEILGVLACDSKKNYAFAKVAEKVLHDCTRQAATLIKLHKQVGTSKRSTKVDQDQLQTFIDRLQHIETEEELLNTAANMPEEIAPYDSLAIVVSSDHGIGRGLYYAANKDPHVSHRLLDLVCRHKRVICNERSVHVPPSDDFRHRSFLSVPFQLLSQQAGALNLLSKPDVPFSSSQIEALEKIARIVGMSLERIRLRERFIDQPNRDGVVTWRQFQIQAGLALEEGLKEGTSMSLICIQFEDLDSLEAKLGVQGTLSLLDRVSRLIEQIKRRNAVACRVFSNKYYVLTTKVEAADFITRFQKLVQRISSLDLFTNQQQNLIQTVKNPGDLLLGLTTVFSAHAPAQGRTVTELCSRIHNITQELRTSK